MVELVSVIIILIVTIYFIRKVKSGKASNSSRNTVNKKKNSTEKVNHIRTAGDKTLYKKKGIKTFDLKGMFYQNLDFKSHTGEFVGFAKCENNSHDKHAVSIFNQENKLLGYAPKGNRRLNNSLVEWNNGKVLVWGEISYDDYDNKWYGVVYIPVGLTSSQLEKLEKVLNLKIENQAQIRKKEKSTIKYFEILDRHREIAKLLVSLNNPSEINYFFPKNLIPSISSHLEKEKNWEELLELEQHQDLIEALNEKYREKTLNRIELAKKMLKKM
ncbi:HIRAN domain-containing protein [Zobellia russellii]|uniref:HIRAN domain-containing protein n=1 Tax=Zobellia russellii TaxID=248907 RepID=UPI001BFFD418|nr:HIRAN domain-containing protein [Zobellia russellii]MBT9189198.1 hypothetical protein [Zobellia russellii]